MNLIIDAGNTRVKLAVFDGDTLIFKSDFIMDELKDKLALVQKKHQKITACIISAVTDLDKKLLKELKETYKTIVLDHSVALPFTNLYATPKTLGVDRMALVSAAAHQYPQKNTLVIDAGTCITYDFKNDKNEYLGGAISPGLQMRYTSLNSLTAKLPLLNVELPKSFIGSSTSQSIHSGVVNGVLQELSGVIDQYKEQFQHLTVILTGGDGNFFAKCFKNGIFANSNFLLEGLNSILGHNTYR